MTAVARSRMNIAIAATITLALFAANFFWLLPRIQHLRQTIDNDRASTIVLTQQQSNLAVLSRDIESIKTKQTELEGSIWLFSKEDDFFAFVDSVAKNNKIAIDPPAIADSTPNGTILSRSAVLILRGPIDGVLAGLSDIQRQSRLIAVQKTSLKASGTPNTVALTVNVITLWK